MGEARRRKQSDPNFGKKPKIQNFIPKALIPEGGFLHFTVSNELSKLVEFLIDNPTPGNRNIRMNEEDWKQALPLFQGQPGFLIVLLNLEEGNSEEMDWLDKNFKSHMNPRLLQEKVFCFSSGNSPDTVWKKVSELWDRFPTQPSVVCFTTPVQMLVMDQSLHFKI